MRARQFFVAALASLAALVLGGCGEEQQVTLYKQGKYQGKPDTKPYDNDAAQATYTRSTWTKGDRSSWEAALKQRALNQDEYTRTNSGG